MLKMKNKDTDVYDDLGIDSQSMEEEIGAVESEKATKQIQRRTKEKSEVKKRFGFVQQPARMAIADLESGEVISEGESLIADALVEILERIERIENRLGNMAEEN